MWGFLTPDVHLHIHGILVSFSSLFATGHVLLGEFLLLEICLGFWVCSFGLFFLGPYPSHHRHPSIISTPAVSCLSFAFLLVDSETSFIVHPFWALVG